MGDFRRGRITRVTFEVEYPDGSKKVSELENPNEIAKISFVENEVAEDDLAAYNVSEDDWKQNPTMMVYPQGGGGIPFCTHDGCKG